MMTGLIPLRRSADQLSLPAIAMVIGIYALLAMPLTVIAEAPDSRNFVDMSIEELMNESITSVSKKEQKLSNAPAAVSVITADDIRGMGVNLLPEALRAVPGLNVGRINANEWAISARGFNSQYATKLLVLVDGRSVYTPSFSGVFWPTLDLMLDDLDRIEVIRGPGATLWGVNAVNGVINVMTKSAEDTQGFLGSVTYGTDLQPLTNLRYGDRLGDDLYYRVYGQFLDHDDYRLANGRDADDEWHSGRTGLRLDWRPQGQDRFTLQGDYYRQTVNQPYEEAQLTPPVGNQLRNDENHNHGGNVLGRWTHTFGPESESSLQLYYDTFHHVDAGTVERRDTVDLDWQHRFALGNRNELVWGLGYRYTPDEIFSKNFVASWDPRRTRRQYFSAFVQDEIKMAPDKLHLILGSKFEHNDYTDFEVQPNARLVWMPTEKQTVWTSVSRAVRTPNRFESTGRINEAAFQPPGSPPILVSLLPSRKLASETILAYELGYRIEPMERLALDLAGFYNQYDHGATFVAGPNRFEPSPPPPHVLVPLEGEYTNSGDTFGIEFQSQWNVTNACRLMAGYTWLHMQLDKTTNRDTPQHQAYLRSDVDVAKNLELNGVAYYVDQSTHAVGIASLTNPSYVRFDLGLSWRPTKAWDLSLWGQNLLDDRHSEFFSYHTSFLIETPRSLFGKVTWSF